MIIYNVVLTVSDKISILYNNKILTFNVSTVIYLKYLENI